MIGLLLKKTATTVYHLLLHVLTLPVPYISESCIEIKMKLKFLFSHFFVLPQKVLRTFKTFIKPFEAPQRNVKKKI